MSYLSDLRTVTMVDASGRSREVVGGSFRGVPFFVASHQIGTGRRIAVHEFPGLDDPYNEDMGRVSRSVSLEAYLLGENAKAQKEKLLQAVEAGGSGKLVHPYLGTKNAQCTVCNLQESSTERNRVGLSLTFVLDPDIRPEAAVQTDLRAESLLKATSAKDAAASRFAKAFSLLKAGKSTIDSAVKSTNKMLDQVEAARGTMRQVAAYVSKVGQIRQNLELLLMTPGDFAARVQDLLTMTEGAVLPSGTSSTRRITTTVGAASVVISAPDQSALLARVHLSEAMAIAVAGSDLPAVPATGAVERTLEAQNQEALVALFQQTATFDTAEKLIGAQVSSVEDAGALQAELGELFDHVQDQTEDPEIYQLAQDVQAAALGYLRETSADLAIVLKNTPRRTVPSLVLSFEIYGTWTRAQDIVDRNSIQHPGFLPGGRELEILSR